jgi:hypothetical protein
VAWVRVACLVPAAQVRKPMTTATLNVGCGGAGEVEREIALLAADPVVWLTYC